MDWTVAPRSVTEAQSPARPPLSMKALLVRVESVIGVPTAELRSGVENCPL